MNIILNNFEYTEPRGKFTSVFEKPKFTLALHYCKIAFLLMTSGLLMTKWSRWIDEVGTNGVKHSHDSLYQNLLKLTGYGRPM